MELSPLRVSSEQGDVVDCVEGASVRLSKQGKLIAETATDNYGDFKLDRLPENSGDYELEISAGNVRRHQSGPVSARASMSARCGCSRRPDMR